MDFILLSDHRQLNLWRACEFWPDDGQCMLRSCAVDECDKKEFEEVWCDERQHVEVENPLSLIDSKNDPSVRRPSLSLPLVLMLF